MKRWNGAVVLLSVVLAGVLAASLRASEAVQPAPTTQPPPRHFLVLMRLGPGYDESLSMAQQPALPTHSAYMKELESKGKVVLGGPLLESFETMRPTGAAVVLRADTAEEARRLAAGDTSGLLEVQEVRAFLMGIAPKP